MKFNLLVVTILSTVSAFGAAAEEEVSLQEIRELLSDRKFASSRSLEKNGVELTDIHNPGPLFYFKVKKGTVRLNEGDVFGTPDPNYHYTITIKEVSIGRVILGARTPKEHKALAVLMGGEGYLKNLVDEMQSQKLTVERIRQTVKGGANMRYLILNDTIITDIQTPNGELASFKVHKGSILLNEGDTFGSYSFGRYNTIPNLSPSTP